GLEAALRVSPVVPAFGDLLDELRGDGRRVGGLAARDQTLVDDDLLVEPLAAGVLDVGPEARVRGELATLDDTRLDQHPRPVADRRDRLARLEERAHEPHDVVVQAQPVGAHGPARYDDRAVVALPRARVGDVAVEIGRA